MAVFRIPAIIAEKIALSFCKRGHLCDQVKRVVILLVAVAEQFASEKKFIIDGECAFDVACNLS